MDSKPKPDPSIAQVRSVSLTDQGAAEQHARNGAREGIRAAILLLATLWIGKHIAGVLPDGGDIVFTAAAALQIYLPLWLIQRGGELPESHRIHVHGLVLGPIQALRAARVRRRRARQIRRRGGLDRWLAEYGRGAYFRGAELRADLVRVLWVVLLTFLPFGLAHHFWQEWMLGRELVFQPTLPPDLLWVVVRNVLLVALPEELFYRGFLETRLDRIWPSRRAWWGIPLGRSVFLASALFALGHFLGEYNLARLGPFFPAFLFSMLTRKSGSIAGAMLYHGLSNAFSYALFQGYFGS